MKKNGTVASVFKIYKRTISIEKKGAEQESFRIDQICRSFLGPMRVRDVSTVDIATYRDMRLAQVNQKTKQALSPATVRLELSLLSAFFNICMVEWGYCDINPVLNVRKPKVSPGRTRIMNPREERQILRYAHNYCNATLYSILVLAIETAMRQSEILGLLWENINLKKRTAFLPDTKNGTFRSVPLTNRAREALMRLGIEREGKVFSYTSPGIKTTWRVMMQALGIKDLHFHDIRHTCITRLVQMGRLNLMEIAAITGHKSLTMLKRYTHLSAEMLARKMEAGRDKGKQVLLDHLIPYPAHVTTTDKKTVVMKLLDFDNLTVEAADYETAVEMAENQLFQRLMANILNSVKTPPPDQYLEMVNESDLIMVHPLEVIRT